MLRLQKYIWDNFARTKGGDFYDNEKEEKATGTMS